MDGDHHHFNTDDGANGAVLPDHDHEDEIIGYVEPWIASPGETVGVKVSSTIPKYTWSLVRIIQGFEHGKAPQTSHELILRPDEGQEIVSGHYREARCGSYGVVPSWKETDKSRLKGISLSCYIEPWLLEAGHDQVVFSALDRQNSSGVALALDMSGALVVHVGVGDMVKTYGTGILLRHRRWAAVDLQVSLNQVSVHVRHCESLVEVAPKPSNFSAVLKQACSLDANVALTLAAGLFFDETSCKALPGAFFNGRIDSPRVSISDDGTTYTSWAKYDFSTDISSDRITDTSEGAHHGVLMNAPTRAVKGHDWDGSQPDWTQASDGYGAIHFHEDDLDDAEWPADFQIRILDDVPSGAYAVVVKGVDEGTEHVSDAITFFVRPPALPSAKKPRVAMVLSTFTYLAYANEHMYDQTRISRMELSGGVRIRKDVHWRKMNRRSDLGCSLYDVHRDGSGAIFSTSRRPILNIRPGYINWAFHRPREFSADQLMIGFLEQQLGRRGYDVLTDHDLHLQGAAALEGYNTVITGCHPEYPSLEILNVYAGFAKKGGNIMYLGGNGFYWCAALDPARPHRVEVRKGDQGCRSVELPAGERVHALNGVQGGLWRARGRTPQSLFGVGSCACGSGPGVPYRFNDDVAKSEKLRWLFKGLGRDEAGGLKLLGTEGFGGGASGDEIDRLDFGLGTPSNAILLATSTGHDDSFGLFNEEIMFPMVNTVGSSCAKIRSDMVVYETSGGGRVFSVGSINWYSSLGWNGYDNDVARLTWNVLEEFIKN